MFEYEQDIVTSLISEDSNFKRLYEKHRELKKQVKEANSGAVAMDDYDLESIKKEKLLLKDRMASIIENHRMTHA